LTKYEKQIDGLEFLFNKDDEGMKHNSIGNWRYCYDENMLRSVTGVLYHNTEMSANTEKDG
jgi:hypothetical protein